jgi:hypothetical protein
MSPVVPRQSNSCTGADGATLTTGFGGGGATCEACASGAIANVPIVIAAAAKVIPKVVPKFRIAVLFSFG